MVALSVILPIYSLVGGLNETPRLFPTPPKKQIAQTTEVVSEFKAAAPKKTLTVRSDIGTLNIRRTPSGTLFGKVRDGETYPYTEVQSGWYLIELPDGSSGWVSGDYVIDNATTENRTPTENISEVVPPSQDSSFASGTPVVEILPTGIGYLNVRKNGVVFTTVTPGKDILCGILIMDG
ncbi:SH3 domain-containing protein [Candidatus Gracilibacteria bacterium]|nr:SH3 domain-containing protein [Candidatus Gracilibacteria bacterium]